MRIVHQVSEPKCSSSHPSVREGRLYCQNFGCHALIKLTGEAAVHCESAMRSFGSNCKTRNRRLPMRIVHQVSELGEPVQCLSPKREGRTIILSKITFESKEPDTMCQMNTKSVEEANKPTQVQNCVTERHSILMHSLTRGMLVGHRLARIL